MSLNARSSVATTTKSGLAAECRHMHFNRFVNLIARLMSGENRSAVCFRRFCHFSTMLLKHTG